MRHMHIAWLHIIPGPDKAWQKALSGPGGCCIYLAITLLKPDFSQASS